MYIWESHMGGLYTTEYDQDYDDLYCEQCGDSDWYIGRADTAEEVWRLLCGDSEDSEQGLLYNLVYIMQFIAENFNLENPTYVYLIGTREDREEVFCKYLKNKTVIPHSFCVDQKYADRIAEQMAFDLKNNAGAFSLIYMGVSRK